MIVIALTLTAGKTTEERNKNLTISDYFLFSISAVCQMEPEIFSKFYSARIATVGITNPKSIEKKSINVLSFILFNSQQFFFFIYLLFIFTSFTANIVALLQTPTNAIKTIADLLNPAIEIGVQDTPYNRFYFSAATEWSRKKLFETRVEPPNAPNAYMNLTYGVSRMRQGMFAFHTDTGMAYNEVERTWFEHEKCGMVN